LVIQAKIREQQNLEHIIGTTEVEINDKLTNFKFAEEIILEEMAKEIKNEKKIEIPVVKLP
jgi:hypothetical protein